MFFGSDFITVTKSDAEWPQLKPAILGVIMEHFMSGAPIVAAGGSAETSEAGEFFEAGRRRYGRDHQGADRDARAAGGRQ